ncbi:MAG: flagellar basal body rod protein FlgB [Clostridia bacterium]|nr:flagellar basal body rod protein FlgB [Clostridia bacterium]
MLETNLVNILRRAMDGSTVKNSVLSNNIANVNTPGFKKSSVSFQQELADSLGQGERLALKRTREKHLAGRPGGEAVVNVSEITNTSLRTDGNNVDIDMEQALLAENNIYFNGLADLLTAQLALLRTSISEGRR